MRALVAEGEEAMRGEREGERMRERGERSE